MANITREVSLQDVPEEWRRGLAIRDGDTMTLVFRVDTPSPLRAKVEEQERRAVFQARQEALQAAAGVWADRSQEEIDALYGDLREADRQRLEALIPKS